MDDGVTAYERERLQRIQENNRKLLSLVGPVGSEGCHRCQTRCLARA